mmetsp:Transcript_16260/g.52941  ORF Transcript_16260/g.52941 Transcript_16260/m.52941 type:complete len:296 (+) Transcript_16260:126-1013(+)
MLQIEVVRRRKGVAGDGEGLCEGATIGEGEVEFFQDDVLRRVVGGRKGDGSPELGRDGSDGGVEGFPGEPTMLGIILKKVAVVEPLDDAGVLVEDVVDVEAKADTVFPTTTPVTTTTPKVPDLWPLFDEAEVAEEGGRAVAVGIEELLADVDVAVRVDGHAVAVAEVDADVVVVAVGVVVEVVDGNHRPSALLVAEGPGLHEAQGSLHAGHLGIVVAEVRRPRRVPTPIPGRQLLNEVEGLAASPQVRHLRLVRLEMPQVWPVLRRIPLLELLTRLLHEVALDPASDDRFPGDKS